MRLNRFTANNGGTSIVDYQFFDDLDHDLSLDNPLPSLYVRADTGDGIKWYYEDASAELTLVRDPDLFELLESQLEALLQSK